jgi:peroxiredoxin
VRPSTLAAGVVAVAALAVGAASWRYLFGPDLTGGRDPASVSGLAVGTPRPDFVLPDLAGRFRQVSEWDGQVLVLNFWATWCPPCRREMPDFMAVQREYGARGLQVVGVALDDPERVAEFVRDLGVEYPTLVGQAGAIDVTLRYGNGAGVLPYTAVVDRSGRVAYARPGELSRERLEALVQPLL